MIALVYPSGCIHVYGEDGKVQQSIRTFTGKNPTDDQVTEALKARGYEPKGEATGFKILSVKGAIPTGIPTA